MIFGDENGHRLVDRSIETKDIFLLKLILKFRVYDGLVVKRWQLDL